MHRKFLNIVQLAAIAFVCLFVMAGADNAMAHEGPGHVVQGDEAMQVLQNKVGDDERQPGQNQTNDCHNMCAGACPSTTCMTCIFAEAGGLKRVLTVHNLVGRGRQIMNYSALADGLFHPPRL